MRDIETKIDNTAPAGTGRLSAAQFNAIQNELENAVSSASITLDLPGGPDVDLYMLAQAMSKTASGGVFCVDTGAINALVLNVITPFRNPKALFRGCRVLGYPVGGNNGPATINAFQLGLKPLYDHAGDALVGGETVANRLIEIVYDPSANTGSGAWKLAPWANQLLLGSASVVNNTYSATLPYIADSGTANHVIAVFSPAISSLAAGMPMLVKIANTNTSTADLKVNALSAVPIKRIDGTDVRAGDLVAGEVALFLYDGTNAQVVSTPSKGLGLQVHGLSGQVFPDQVLTFATTWGTTDFNTFKTSTLISGVFTCGAGEGGMYAVNLSLTIDNAHGYPAGMAIAFAKNGSLTGPYFPNVTNQVGYFSAGGSSNSDPHHQLMAQVYLAPGDTFQPAIYVSTIGASPGASTGYFTSAETTRLTLSRVA